MKSNPCGNCDKEMVRVSNTQLNIGLLLFLIILGVLPGVIYYIIIKLSDNWVCPNCVTEFAKDALDSKKGKSDSW
jgi:hypothetical protein